MRIYFYLQPKLMNIVLRHYRPHDTPLLKLINQRHIQHTNTCTHLRVFLEAARCFLFSLSLRLLNYKYSNICDIDMFKTIQTKVMCENISYIHIF